MCDKCNHVTWEEKLERIIDDTEYDFALETLEGIQHWVLAHDHITQKQKDAIINISHGVEGRRAGED